jgi:hypothetical protein
MRKSLSEHLDKIEKKKTFEEILSAEIHLQRKLKKVMMSMKIKELTLIASVKT